MKSFVSTEKAFMEGVIDLARLKGYRVYHTFDSRRSASGFPDLVMVRTKPMPHLIFAELKTDAGDLTPEQEAWLDALAKIPVALEHAGVLGVIDVRVWRPHHWQQIQEALA